MKPYEQQTLPEKLRGRAQIRRGDLSRKSVQEGRPDRAADLMEEAAARIEELEDKFRSLGSQVQDMMNAYEKELAETPVAVSKLSLIIAGEVMNAGRKSPRLPSRAQAEAVELWIRPLVKRLNDFDDAARALVERWDSPSWKDLPNTGLFVDALRKLLKQ